MAALAAQTPKPLSEQSSPFDRHFHLHNGERINLGVPYQDIYATSAAVLELLPSQRMRTTVSGLHS